MKHLMRHIAIPRSMGRFLIVGGFNTAVGIFMFPILYWIFSQTIEFNILLAISYVLCTLLSFLSHKFLTFKSQGSVWAEGLKFATLSGFNYLLNLLLLKLLLPIIPWHPLWVQTLITVFLALANYAGMNQLVFATLPSVGIIQKWLRNKP